ncbi:conserved protein [Lachnospiraceae bacterium KM106-2]|nr:conserved protein [Lachnospiraceae bacterium KM106-2]
MIEKGVVRAVSKIYRFRDYIMIGAEYRDPQLHKHLASHIMISLGEMMKWRVGNDEVMCRGIVIGPDVEHTGSMSKEGAIVLLFPGCGEYSRCLEERVLQGRAYLTLRDEAAIEAANIYKEALPGMNERILSLCGLDSIESPVYEERVRCVLDHIESIKTIPHSIMEDLAEISCLSKSRLSHLFKEQTGMTLHSYLAFQKLQKTHRYYREGMSLTDACLLAGFDSSSHCSSTCKRMFGISMTEVYKTIATK